MGIMPHIGITSGRHRAMHVEAKQTVAARMRRINVCSSVRRAHPVPTGPYNLTPSSSFHLIVELLSPSSSVTLPKLNSDT